MAGWGRLTRNLGDSLVRLLRAELDQLEGDFGRTASLLRAALGLLAIAAFVAFWTVGLLAALGVAVLALWLPLWGAMLVMLGLLAIVVGLTGWLGVRRLATVENPLRTVRRRADDHLAWWQARLDAMAAAEEATMPGASSIAAAPVPLPQADPGAGVEERDV